MTILERLEQLKKNNFYINHKALGVIQMVEDFDLVRIRRDYDFITTPTVCNDIIDKIDKELLHTEIIKEESWCFGEVTLDLFIE